MSYFYYIYCHFSLCNHLIPYKQDAWIGQMPKAVLRRQDFDDFPTSSQSDNYTYAVIFPFCCCCSFSIILWFEDCKLLCSFASGTQLTKIPVKWLSVWLGYSCYFVARVCYRKKFFFLLFFFFFIFFYLASFKQRCCKISRTISYITTKCVLAHLSKFISLECKTSTYLHCA